MGEKILQREHKEGKGTESGGGGGALVLTGGGMCTLVLCGGRGWPLWRERG